MPRCVPVCFVLFAALNCALPALGVDYFWNNPNGGAFGVQSNWGPVAGGPGDGDDTVNFELGQSTEERYAVIGVSGQNDRLLVHDDALTLVLSDDYSLLSIAANEPSMVVGVANGEVGDVIISGSPLGGVSSILDTGRVVLAQSAGSTGVVTASNLRWESGVIVVGDSGEGTLSIVGGSHVTGASTIGANVNSTGAVTVSGADSTWDNFPIGGVSVGHEGSGTLTISDGGSVSSFVAEIGGRSGSTGAATVTGAGSSWISDNEILVGYSGAGSLTIEAGGRVENDLAGYIGYELGSTGTVTVRGNGSSWTNKQLLLVGYLGDAMLTISDRGSVSNDRGWIGYESEGSGEVIVTGAGSTWTNSEELDVGRDGMGALRIEAGGAVFNTIGRIAALEGSTGTAIVVGTGSTWTNSEFLQVGNDGEGTLTISAGGRVTNTGGFIGERFDSIGSVMVEGTGSRWTNSGGLHVGSDGTGTLTIIAGGRVFNTTARVGGNPLGIGTAVVAGQGSEWASSSLLVVGHFGAGILTIETGGNVSNTSGIIGDIAGSTGSVIVRGAGSNWTNVGSLQVGDAGEGRLTIQDGGEVVNFTDGSIGVASGSIGTVTMRDAGSRWANGDFLRVGNEGDGILNIFDGAEVTNGNGRIAAGPGSTGDVIVRGADSTWTNSSTLNVGSIGAGTLSIESGGRVSNTSASIGATSAASGEVTVLGSGSMWASNGELRVGSSGSGRLTIQAGGSVSSTSGIIASSANSTGRVTVTGAGSNWTIGGRLSIAGNAVSGLNGGTGFLNVQPGGTVDVEHDIVLFPDGLLTLEGGTLATTGISFERGGEFDWSSGTLHIGIFEGSLTNPAGGTLAPGRSAGSATILGDYTQSARATLEIEIGGSATATGFDFVDVNGTATLGGQLELSLINGFLPDPADEFVIFNADEGLQSFFTNAGNGARLDTIDGLGSFLIHYGPTSAFDPNQIVLSDFIATLIGDYNDDGSVDAADYVVWRQNEGTNNPLPNDLIGGEIGAGHYGQWRNNFGNTETGGGASYYVAVPEPISAVVLVVGLIAVGSPRRAPHRYAAFAGESRC